MKINQQLLTIADRVYQVPSIKCHLLRYRERDLLEENEKLNQQIRQMNDLNESLRSKNEKDDMVEELENDFHNFPNEIEELRAYENKLLQENLNLKEYLQVQKYGKGNGKCRKEKSQPNMLQRAVSF